MRLLFKLIRAIRNWESAVLVDEVGYLVEMRRIKLETEGLLF